MKYVFIVERGEDGEGTAILGVFKGSIAAVNHAKGIASTMPFKMQETNSGSDDVLALWQGGCDYLQVTRYPVR